ERAEDVQQPLALRGADVVDRREQEGVDRAGGGAPRAEEADAHLLERIGVADERDAEDAATLHHDVDVLVAGIVDDVRPLRRGAAEAGTELLQRGQHPGIVSVDGHRSDSVASGVPATLQTRRRGRYPQTRRASGRRYASGRRVTPVSTRSN